MFKATPFKASVRPDATLRHYAWFEDPAPAPAPPPEPAPNPDPKPVAFTEEQQKVIDKLVGGARGDGKKTALADFLKELGFEKADDLKTLIKTVKDQEEAKKTDAEKAAAKVTQLEKERDEAKAALDNERMGRLSEKRDSKLKDALSALNIKKDRAEAALKLLTVDQAEALKAALKEDGSIDDKALSKIAEDAKKSYPEWFSTGGVGSPSNNQSMSSMSDANKAAREANFARARRGN